MREPRFWRRDGATARLLAPASMIYGAVAAWRLRRDGRRAAVPVLCVGNFTVGGAGKTPTALALARLLLAAGLRPAFLTRGYGGALAGPLWVDPKHRAADVGDEPLLLARVAPTILARDRVAGAALAADTDIIIMDDGFQNPALAKDFSLVVVDGTEGVGNGRVFPGGPLRAPLAAQFARAQALLVIGEPAPSVRELMADARARGLPLLAGRLVPDPAAVAALADKKVLAFAGIAHPEKFFATLEEAGIAAPVRRAFADHHRYDARECAELLAQAEREGLLPLTTEKDKARLAGDAAAAALAAAAQALPVQLTFADDGLVRRLLLERMPTLAARRTAANTAPMA